MKMGIFIRKGQEQGWSEEDVELLFRSKESSAYLGESCRVSDAHQSILWQVEMALCIGCCLPQEGYNFKQGSSLQLR